MKDVPGLQAEAEARRVLVLSHEDPAHPRGGLGVVVGELCREFEDLGAEVTLITAASVGPRLPRREPALDPYALPLPAERGPALMSFGERALAAAEVTRPHVVHAHDWLALDAALRLRRQRPVRVVAHVHSTEWDRTLGRVDPWILRREGEGLRAADHVLCVSARTQALVVARHEVRPERTTVVRPGLPRLPRIAQSEPSASQREDRPAAGAPPLVLFLGRFVPQKGVDLFLRAALRVRHVLPRARFVLAGDGPGFQDAVERAVDLGLGRSVRFTGHVARTEVARLLRRADCLLVPSLAEPYGLVGLEAARDGTPVVASRACGFAEVLEPFVSFDPLDAEGAADGVVAALQEAARVRQWAQRAARALEGLAPAESAARVLLELLGHHAQAPSEVSSAAPASAHASARDPFLAPLP